jgi:hypothetical protein
LELRVRVVEFGVKVQDLGLRVRGFSGLGFRETMIYGQGFRV